jgi:hypothetical protein
MSARIATKQLKDGANQSFLQPALDVSGTGLGPFAPLVAVSNADGTRAVDLEALLTSLATALAAIQTTLAANNTPLTSLNGGLASTTTAVNAVTSAVTALQALTSAGNATEAQVLAATNTLQTTLTAVQALDTSGNAALNVLHTDEINLASIVATGNAALAAIQTSTGLGSTAANQALAQASLTALTTSASTELAKLDALTLSVSALGTTLGAGKSLADIVTALNPNAKTADIEVLKGVLSGFEASEIALLTDVKALLATLVTASSQPTTAVTQSGAFSVSVANHPTGLASEATLAQVLAALTANTTAIGLVNTSVAGTTAAVNAVAVATTDLKALVATGNATEAQVLAASTALQTTLTAVQALDVAGNAALSALHNDEISLAALVTTGNAALASIQTSAGLQATAANQALAKTALDALNVATLSELTKLDTIATSIAALGTSLGGGKSLSDVVLAVNANAKPADIDALKLAINANETAELAKLTTMDASLTAIATAANQTSTPVTIAGVVAATINNLPATQVISAAALPLPTGASTDGTDATGVAQLTGGVGIRGWLSGIFQKLSNPLVVTGAFFQSTQPVSAAALPLPTGAASEASLALLHADMLAPLPTGANTIGNVNVIGGNASAVKTIASSGIVFDMPLTPVTVDGFLTIAADAGQSLAAVVKVTVASGTLDLVLRESFDDGENFQDIYHLERISGVGTFTIPNMLMHGRRQWMWKVSSGGSFIFKITSTRGANPVQAIRRFFVRGLDTTLAGGVTPAFNIEGFKFISFGAKMNSGGIAPVLQFKVSPDNVSYAFYSTTLTAATNAFSLGSWTAYGALIKFAQIAVQTAGAASVNDYIVINASN